MGNPLDDEKANFHVLTNAEGQHSLWPVFARVPDGWDIALKNAARSVCVSYIETNWTDMRPNSLQEAMKREGEGVSLAAPRLG